MEFITQGLVDTSEQHLRSTVKLVSKQLAVYRIAATLCDHHLPFQSCSFQQSRRFDFITERHCSKVE